MFPACISLFTFRLQLFRIIFSTLRCLQYKPSFFAGFVRPSANWHHACGKKHQSHIWLNSRPKWSDHLQNKRKKENLWPYENCWRCRFCCCRWLPPHISLRLTNAYHRWGSPIAANWFSITISLATKAGIARSCLGKCELCNTLPDAPPPKRKMRHWSRQSKPPTCRTTNIRPPLSST